MPLRHLGTMACCIEAILLILLVPIPVAAQSVMTASAVADGYATAGAADGDRFSCQPHHMWQSTAAKCWWQIQFAEPRRVGAILQINGDHPVRLQNSPRNYAWQWSHDGVVWSTLRETVVCHETRLFRIHRLQRSLETTYLRCMVFLADGSAATLREVEFYADTDAAIPFDHWIVSVGSFEDREQTFTDTRFIDLARQCPGWEQVPAQLVWHGEVTPEYVKVEPRPLCLFLSGSFLEWCQCSREPWRGIQQIVKQRSIPIWGSCGGAQILAILEETGVDQPWDCPRCRDPAQPLLSVYSHIGHTGPAPCGDYQANIGERGRFQMRKVADDAALAGLPELFEVMESHVGQIAHVPNGWTRLVTNGPGALTENQCLRVRDYPVYAAQFHIEMEGTPETSRQIMTNFLELARNRSRLPEESR